MYYCLRIPKIKNLTQFSLVEKNSCRLLKYYYLKCEAQFLNLTCILGKLKEQNVIFCHFEFDPELLAHFKKSFPSGSWLRTNKCWHLTHFPLNRKRLGLEPKSIRSGFEVHIHGY